MTEFHSEPFDHHRGKLPLLRAVGPGRMLLFMVLNLACFVVVNAFWLYLSTGAWVDFSPASYARDLGTPLGETFVYPLNLFAHKWMILVTGLLLGLLIFLPIIVAVLYRLVFALLFAGAVALLGHAVGLAVALAMGCFLAARTPLRSDMPFLAFLLGMVPAALYLVLFAFAGSEPAALPIEQLVIRAPLLIAAVAAVLAAVVVLALARAMRYRSGLVWPVLAVLSAVPMVVFYSDLGADELDYDLIAYTLIPGDSLFEPVSLESWCKENGGEGLRDETLRAAVLDDLERRKGSLIAKCDGYVAKYPQSAQSAAVLWIKAQCQSLQLSEGSLDAGLVRYSASYPLADSETTWLRLAREWSLEPQAALAQWRLGELHLRDGEMQLGLDRLEKARVKLKNILERKKAFRVSPQPSQRMVSSSTFMPRRNYYENAQFAVERTIWTVEQNRVLSDPPAAEALRAYLQANPYQEHYLQRLRELATLYGPTRMGDNLWLAVAVNTPDLETRVTMLEWLANRRNWHRLFAQDWRQCLAMMAQATAESWRSSGRSWASWQDLLAPANDAAVEANFELAQLAMQQEGSTSAPAVLARLKSPRYYFRQVVDAGPSPWAKLAQDWLSWFDRKNRE